MEWINFPKINTAATDPFEHILMPQFFHEENVAKLKSALMKQTYYKKDCDLYKLKQTDDLKNAKEPIIKDFYQFMNSKPFLEFIAVLTGLKPKRADMSAMVYEKTGYLLCHDDQLDSRKIAYILNLSDLSEADGGSLDLFSTKQKKPYKIVKSIYPKYNQFVLFKVGSTSFHQVSEVISDTKRLTVAGWFHG